MAMVRKKHAGRSHAQVSNKTEMNNFSFTFAAPPLAAWFLLAVSLRGRFDLFVVRCVSSSLWHYRWLADAQG